MPRQGATATHEVTIEQSTLAEMQAKLEAFEKAEAERKAKGQKLREAREAKARAEGKPIRQPKAAATPKVATLEEVQNHQMSHPRWAAVEFLTALAEKRVDAGASIQEAALGIAELYRDLVERVLERRPEPGKRPHVLATIGTLVQDHFPEDFARLGPAYGNVTNPRGAKSAAKAEQSAEAAPAPESAGDTESTAEASDESFEDEFDSEGAEDDEEDDEVEG